MICLKNSPLLTSICLATIQSYDGAGGKNGSTGVPEVPAIAVVMWLCSLTWLRLQCDSCSHMITICNLPCQLPTSQWGRQQGRLQVTSVSHSCSLHICCLHRASQAFQASRCTFLLLTWDFHLFLLNSLYVLGLQQQLGLLELRFRVLVALLTDHMEVKLLLLQINIQFLCYIFLFLRMALRYIMKTTVHSWLSPAWYVSLKCLTGVILQLKKQLT